MKTLRVGGLLLEAASRLGWASAWVRQPPQREKERPD